MNRIQFFVLTGLSGLVLVLMIAHLYLVRQVSIDQNTMNLAQREVSQAQVFQGNLKQLALRLYSDSQKTQDQGLKDLLARQQITFNPATNSTETPAAPTPSPTH
jgi:hypothetical protein